MPGLHPGQGDFLRQSTACDGRYGPEIAQNRSVEVLGRSLQAGLVCLDLIFVEAYRKIRLRSSMPL